MRTRVLDERSDLIINRYRDMSYTNNCVGQSSSYNVENCLGTYRKTTDVEIRDFHKRVARGEVFINPFSSYQEQRYIDAPGWDFTRQVSGGYQCYRESGDGPLWLFEEECPKAWHANVAMDIPNLRRRAGTAAKANVNAPEVEGLVTLGELRESIELLRNPVKAITDYIRKDQRRLRKHLVREREFLANQGKTFAAVKQLVRNGLNNPELKALSSAYLTVRYGIMPAVREAQDIVTAIQSLQHKVPERHTARGFVTESDTVTRNGPNGSFSKWNFTSTDTTTQEVEIRAGILYEVRTKDTFGMSISQIPAAAWNLVPLSFMTDWSWNVGNYLSAITPRMGINVLGSWTVTRKVRTTERAYTFVFTKSSDPEYTEIINPSGTETVMSRNVTRKRGVEVGLAYNPKIAKIGLSAAKIADSLAIARQLLSKW